MYEKDGTIHITPADNGRTIDLSEPILPDGSAEPLKNLALRSSKSKQLKDITLVGGNFRRLTFSSGYSYEEVKPKSFEPDYLQFLDGVAPKNITLKKMSFYPNPEDNGAIYTCPGLSGLKIFNCQFRGSSSSITIYLNSEVNDVLISSNVFFTEGGREHIAVDGAYNCTIQKCKFANTNGSVHLYRNHGEGGRNRWNQPHNVLIQENQFTGSVPAVHLNSRHGIRCYAMPHQDTELTGTTLDDNRSMPSGNSVLNNEFIGGNPEDLIIPTRYSNVIRGNYSSTSNKQPEYGHYHRLLEEAEEFFYGLLCAL